MSCSKAVCAFLILACICTSSLAGTDVKSLRGTTNGVQPRDGFAIGIKPKSAQLGAHLPGWLPWIRRSPPQNPPTPTPTPYTPPPPTPTPSICLKSTMKGFVSMVELGTKGFRLHWQAYGSYLVVAVEVLPVSNATSGWVAIGWSPTGGMAGTDAVVANSNFGPLAAFHLPRQGVAERSTDFQIGYPKLTVSPAGLVFSFTRQEGTGTVPVTTSGSSNIVYSYSLDNTQALQFHGLHHGSDVVDFSCMPQ